MESKKINQLATEMSPETSDLTIIGDPITGVSKKISLLQIANLFATTGTVSSVAVTETGDALTITGSPITSTGTINIGFAGAANQYVRGDGALADFPTSTGGGSSVSYYLNSSVSQGTIGGVAYREFSKDPIAGAGTDITASTNGYIASYITDANDPALLEVPAGNFNCELYFSVNSNAHNPYVYAEIYKYDGTTFTLLGSSQSVPEYLTNGTTLSPYYFAIPVTQTALTLTDRIAIRIYANVDGREVTLHTENNHLCQVVTTFSKGLTSLNNLTRQVQFLAVGTSGTDFNIVSSGDTHTFNIPSASASNRGLVTIGSQSFEGIKTFNDAIKGEEGVLLKNGVISSSNGYTALNAFENTLIITSLISGTPYSNSLEFTPSTTNTYTFPNASGTIALTSNLSSYVPYTGATGDVNLGLFSIISNRVSAIGDNSTYGGVISIKQNNVIGGLIGTGYTELFGKTNRLGISFGAGSIAYLSNSVLTAERTYTLPDITGTLALLEGAQTFTGKKTFSNGVNITGDVILSGGTGYGGGIRYNQGIIQAYGSSETTTEFTDVNSIKYYVGQGSGNYKNFVFDVNNITLNATRTYSLPDASGTIALTSNLSSYVPYTGATGAVNLGTNELTSGNAKINDTLYLKVATTYAHVSGYYGIQVGTNLFTINNSASTQAAFSLASLTTSRTFTLPDATGTIALTSQIPANPVGGTGTTNYLPKFTGASTIGNSLVVDNGTNVGIGITNPTAGRLQINVSDTTTAAHFQIVDGTTTLANSFVTNFRNANDGDGRYSLSRWQVQNAVGNDQIGFIGVQSITGAGAYTPNIVFGQRTGVSTYATRMTLDASGNLGLGVTSPTDLLTLQRNDGRLRFNTTAGTRVMLLGDDFGSGGFMQIYDASGNVKVNFGAGLNYFNGGNLLVGTTTDAGYKLDVNGTGRFSGLVRVEGQYVQIVNATNPSLYLNNTITQWQLKNNSSNNLVFNDGAADRITFANGGAATFSSTIRSDATNGLALGSVSGYRRLQYDLASTTFGFLTDTNSVANIDAGSATFNNNVTIISPSSSANVGTTGQLKISSSTGVTSPASDIYLQAVVDSATPGDRGTAFVVQTGRTSGIAERFRISSTGAATFSSSVTAGGDLFLSLSTASIVFNSAANFNTQIYQTGGSLVLYTGANPRLTIASTGAATFSSSVNMGGDLALTPNDSAIIFSSGAGRFFAGGAERMRITSGGNVGIGTSSPSQKLEVAGVIRGEAVNVYGSTNPASTSPYLYSPSLGALGFGANGSERMRITSSGNLLIDTATDAGYRLEVNGTARATNLRATTDLYLDRTGVAPAIVLNQSSIRLVDAAASSTVTIKSINNNFEVSGAIINSGNLITQKSSGGGSFKQVVVGQKTAAASGVSMKIAYVGFTHAVRVYVWANQSTANGATAVADFTTMYGSSNGGVTYSSTLGNVSAISISYDNGGSPAYTINVTLTYSGAAPTINFVVEGINNDNNIYVVN